MNGKIYTIRDIANPNITLYVGSTTCTLAQRWSCHEKREVGREIVPYENYPCNTKLELVTREEEIRLLLQPTLNVIKCTRGYDLSGLPKSDCREYQQQLRSQNPDLYKADYMRYNIAHRAEHRAYDNNKVTCGCGCMVSRSYLSKHKKRKIHKKRLVTRDRMKPVLQELLPNELE
jgi:hypothetical protein